MSRAGFSLQPDSQTACRAHAAGMTREVSRLSPDADASRHLCSFKMTEGTSCVTALLLLVTIPCLEVIVSSKGWWVGAHGSGTKVCYFCIMVLSDGA